MRFRHPNLDYWNGGADVRRLPELVADLRILRRYASF